MKRWLWVGLLALSNVWAAARATYGGTLRIATIVSPQFDVPWTHVDGPEEAVWSTLSREGLCRMGPDGLRWVLATSVKMVSPTIMRITLLPGLKQADGRAFTTENVLAEWRQLLVPIFPTPYVALLEPFLVNGKLVVQQQTPLSMDFEVNAPIEAFLPSLCHPALSFSGMGAFAGNRGSANLYYANGRPFLDNLDMVVVPNREQEAPWRQKKFEVGVGMWTEGFLAEGKSLFATYLGFRADRVEPSMRQAFEQLDRDELRRMFVKAPAFPMTDWLPWALTKPRPLAPRPHVVPQTVFSRPFQLLYDESLVDQKSVALRLQLKMHELGYRLVPQGLPRKQLRARWQSGDYDLILHTLLLPPHTPSALHLLSALSRPKVRSPSTTELEPLDLIPLYSQGLRLTTRALGVSFDGQGLPRFDDAVFKGE